MVFVGSFNHLQLDISDGNHFELECYQISLTKTRKLKVQLQTRTNMDPWVKCVWSVLCQVCNQCSVKSLHEVVHAATGPGDTELIPCLLGSTWEQIHQLLLLRSRSCGSIRAPLPYRYVAVMFNLALLPRTCRSERALGPHMSQTKRVLACGEGGLVPSVIRFHQCLTLANDLYKLLGSHYVTPVGLGCTVIHHPDSGRFFDTSQETPQNTPTQKQGLI